MVGVSVFLFRIDKHFLFLCSHTATCTCSSLLILAVDIVCNECNDDADCNLNGVCKEDGRCECFEDVEGVQFIGPHCSVRIEDACQTIYGGECMRDVLSYIWLSFSCTEMYISLPFTIHTEEHNDTWKVAPLGWGQGLFQEYDRPVYVYQGGHPLINDSESDATFLFIAAIDGLVLENLEGRISSEKTSRSSSKMQ